MEYGYFSSIVFYSWSNIVYRLLCETQKNISVALYIIYAIQYKYKFYTPNSIEPFLSQTVLTI